MQSSAPGPIVTTKTPIGSRTSKTTPGSGLGIESVKPVDFLDQLSSRYGWAIVSFNTKRGRNSFLEDEERHYIRENREEVSILINSP